MSKSRLLRTLRRLDYWRPMVEALDEADVRDWEVVPPSGLGHPILTFTACGRKVRIALPTTPSGRGKAAQYIPCMVRQAARGVVRGAAQDVVGRIA